MRDTHTSYTDKRTLLAKIDALPSSVAQFESSNVTVIGDVCNDKGDLLREELEVFHRNPVECVADLLSTPTLRDSLHYAPSQVFVDDTCTDRIYHDMWTADWWWETQVCPTNVMQSTCIHFQWLSGAIAPWSHSCSCDIGFRQDTTLSFQW